MLCKSISFSSFNSVGPCKNSVKFTLGPKIFVMKLILPLLSSFRRIDKIIVRIVKIQIQWYQNIVSEESHCCRSIFASFGRLFGLQRLKTFEDLSNSGTGPSFCKSKSHDILFRHKVNCNRYECTYKHEH